MRMQLSGYSKESKNVGLHEMFRIPTQMGPKGCINRYSARNRWTCCKTVPGTVQLINTSYEKCRECYCE